MFSLCELLWIISQHTHTHIFICYIYIYMLFFSPNSSLIGMENLSLQRRPRAEIDECEVEVTQKSREHAQLLCYSEQGNVQYFLCRLLLYLISLHQQLVIFLIIFFISLFSLWAQLGKKWVLIVQQSASRTMAGRLRMLLSAGTELWSGKAVSANMPMELAFLSFSS